MTLRHRVAKRPCRFFCPATLFLGRDLGPTTVNPISLGRGTTRRAAPSASSKALTQTGPYVQQLIQVPNSYARRVCKFSATGSARHAGGICSEDGVWRCFGGTRGSFPPAQYASGLHFGKEVFHPNAPDMNFPKFLLPLGLSGKGRQNSGIFTRLQEICSSIKTRSQMGSICGSKRD
jgi:hypothetical protein